MTAKDEPILTCLDRLNMMEGPFGGNEGLQYRSGRSSSTSVASTVTVTVMTSDFLSSSSPKKSLEKRCRPIDAIIVETQVKGNLVDRLVQLEDRVLKLEQEIEAERKREQVEVEKSSSERKSSKKGFKGLVTACQRKTQILTTDVHVTCFIYWSMIMSFAS